MDKEKYLDEIEKVIASGRYKDSVEGLAEYPYPQWFEDAKLGIFLHWGVYSVPAFFSEWYPRMMYYKGNPVYWHHRLKYGKDFNYKDFIPEFKAENFNPDEWIDMFKNAGAKFVMPVGEHHDGFKMYDSTLSDWNSVKMGPHRDILAEIKTSCEKKSVTFCTSSHRAEHYWFLNGARTIGYETDVSRGIAPDFYGPCFNPYKRSNLPIMLKQERELHPTKEWLEDWLVSSCEMIDKYHPRALFFDWWICNDEAFFPYTLKFAAYYCNRSEEWGENICIFYKSDRFKSDCFVLDKERSGLSDIFPKVWQCETSTSHNSWSFCTTNIFKSPESIIKNFVDVISKRGTYCINLGPKADGTICEKEQSILKSIGDFTKKNQEAIWGTHPFSVSGEGQEQKTGGLYHEGMKYTSSDFRFTSRDKVIYCFAMCEDSDNTYRIKTLKKNSPDLTGEIKWISLLGYKCDIKYLQNNEALIIKAAKNIDTKMPLCFKIELL